jgi:hypothetical protein
VHTGVWKERGPALARIVTIFAAAMLAACDGDRVFSPPADNEWQWTDLGGPDAATPELVGNHETLVIAGNTLLLGTADGVWRRPLNQPIADWQRAGLEGRTIHALTQTAGDARLVAAGYDPRDERAPTAWYSVTLGLDWVEAATWPRAAPGSPDAGTSFRFASLEPDPVDADIVYGGLDADSIAVTIDGGATFLLTDGATMPNFGYPCVPHRPRVAKVLLQGCELPLDVAWVGARDVDTIDRFTLAGFRFVFGYPDLAEIGNRRINSIVPVHGRDDRILVGVEGGLLELTSTDGKWSGRDAVDARVIYRSDGDNPSRPYAYIRAIAPLRSDGRHVLFGGTVNGTNEVLSLFETANGGLTVRRLPTPMGFIDPRVEQAIALAADDVLLVISDVDAADRRSSAVYRLRRP